MKSTMSGAAAATLTLTLVAAPAASAQPATETAAARLNICVAATNDNAGRYFGFSVKPAGEQFSSVLGTVKTGYDKKPGCMSKPVPLPSGAYNVILEGTERDGKPDYLVVKYVVKGPKGTPKTVKAPKKQPLKFPAKATVAENKVTTVTFYSALRQPFEP